MEIEASSDVTTNGISLQSQSQLNSSLDNSAPSTLKKKNSQSNSMRKRGISLQLNTSQQSFNSALADSDDKSLPSKRPSINVSNISVEEKSSLKRPSNSSIYRERSPMTKNAQRCIENIPEVDTPIINKKFDDILAAEMSSQNNLLKVNGDRVGSLDVLNSSGNSVGGIYQTYDESLQNINSQRKESRHLFSKKSSGVSFSHKVKNASQNGLNTANGLNNSQKILSKERKELPPMTIMFDLPTEQNNEKLLQQYRILNSWTLSFLEKEIDNEYAFFFANNNMKIWRQGLSLAVIISTVLFYYNYLVRERPNVFMETLILCFTILFPIMLLFLSSFTLSSRKLHMAQYVHHFSTFFTLTVGCAISLRHYILEREEPTYKTGFFYLLLVNGAHIIFHVRFLYLIIIMIILCSTFIIETILSSKLENIEDAVISTICLVSGMLIVATSSYKLEKESRYDFLNTRKTENNTIKLMEQLKRLHKTYSHQVADFDSPLEKSILLVKSILSDPSLESSHMDSLGRLLGLLKSGDLMTPDIEKQVDGGLVELDKDQEAWLFSNLYRNRAASGKNIKSSFSHSQRRRSTNLSGTPLEDESNPTTPTKLLNTPDITAKAVTLRRISLTTGTTASLTNFENENVVGQRKLSLKPQLSSEKDNKARRQSLVQKVIEKVGSKGCNEKTTHKQTEPEKADFFTGISLKEGKATKTTENSPNTPNFDSSIGDKNVLGSDKSLASNSRPSDTILAAEVAHAILTVGPKVLQVTQEEEVSLSTVNKNFIEVLEGELSELDKISMPQIFISEENSDNNLERTEVNLKTIKEGEEMESSEFSERLQPPYSSVKSEEEEPRKSASSMNSINVSLYNAPDDLIKHCSIVSILEKSDHWNWEIFDLFEASKGWPLFSLSHFLFSKQDLFRKFRIQKKPFMKFLTHIETGYHSDVPYHNSIHACDVLHGMNWLKDRCSSIVTPTDLELLAMYVAAIIHDFDHVLSTLDIKALLYNDRSVLENHHLAAAFAVLLRPEYNCNFLSNLTKEEFKQLREIIIEMVLATDLQTHHFVMISQFKNKISVTETFNPENNQEDRLLLWKMMIKSADVSNPTKKMHIYEKWTLRILEEFFHQGDEEKRVGIPVSPYFDRDTINVPQSQLGFIEFICIPLYESFNSFMSIPCILEGLRINRLHWLQLKEEKIQEQQQQQQLHQQQQQVLQPVQSPNHPQTPSKGIQSPKASMSSLHPVSAGLTVPKNKSGSKSNSSIAASVNGAGSNMALGLPASPLLMQHSASNLLPHVSHTHPLQHSASANVLPQANYQPISQFELSNNSNSRQSVSGSGLIKKVFGLKRSDKSSSSSNIQP
ncbi:cAMP-specific 3',5'-cyclic phosphodiesterase 4B [Clydaea vesicula]|uniref:cAMP-specific 3',5'-cyclic phosphodiesterase 4B n=1 Tax=Clydaea vesicula TaxID=447962 RepID=A0AAD5U5F1_9FUNG|nr:cAMP-specific 3',5'-cyclic phosphodiesterase 4B [Clydaea vesicula]